MIKKENVESLFESKFVKVFDLHYAEGKHYYDATRRGLDDLIAVKDDEEFKTMLPDAVTCIVVLNCADISDKNDPKAEGKSEPRLLLAREYRYPAGQFLLSPPAGLIDPEDRDKSDPLLTTARREIFEETGITVKDTDRLEIVNPLLFSTPGMTDESNALVLAVIDLEDLSCMNQNGCVGSELFDGFVLVTRDEAREILRNGCDSQGIFYSVYTWAALMYFVSEI